MHRRHSVLVGALAITALVPAVASTAAAAPPAKAAPAFSGTYLSQVTVVSARPKGFFGTNPLYKPGATYDRTWTVTPLCTSGPCDVNVKSSSGLTIHLTYADGKWTGTAVSKQACQNTGGKETIQNALTVTPVDSAAALPYASLTLAQVQKWTGCGYGTGVARFDAKLTRKGN